MARNLNCLEAGETAPGAAEQRVDIDDDIVNVDGIKLKKS